jgi:hypothetical protein
MAIKIEAQQPHHHKSPHTKHKMSSTSALTQITALLPQLSFRDGLTLLRLITLDLTMSKESSAAYRPSVPALETKALEAKEAAPAPSVAASAEAKEANVPKEAKAPKMASGGTMAWMGFVKHCQETQPSRFADSKDRGHVLSVAKEIRHEDEDAYKSFVAEWQTDDEAGSASEAEAAPLASQPKKAKKAKPAAAEAGDEPKAKRAANPGILAFTAYSKHLMETQPQLFTEAKSHGDKLKIVSQSSKDNKEAYEAFVGEWKTAHSFSAAANYLKASPAFVPSPMVGGGASIKED